jgi:hypothetical protein
MRSGQTVLLFGCDMLMIATEPLRSGIVACREQRVTSSAMRRILTRRERRVRCRRPFHESQLPSFR